MVSKQSYIIFDDSFLFPQFIPKAQACLARTMGKDEPLVMEDSQESHQRYSCSADLGFSFDQHCHCRKDSEMSLPGPLSQTGLSYRGPCGNQGHHSCPQTSNLLTTPETLCLPSLSEVFLATGYIPHSLEALTQPHLHSQLIQFSFFNQAPENTDLVTLLGLRRARLP